VWIATSEKGVAYFFTALAQLANWLAHEIAQLAKSAFSMGRGILRRVHHLMQQYVKAIVLPLIHIVVHRLILGIKRQLHLIRVRIQALRHGVSTCITCPSAPSAFCESSSSGACCTCNAC
jgi:hypothetical protein